MSFGGPFLAGVLRTCVPCLLVNPAMLGAPLQLGALSVRLVRLWVNPALDRPIKYQRRRCSPITLFFWQYEVLRTFAGFPGLEEVYFSPSYEYRVTKTEYRVTKPEYRVINPEYRVTKPEYRVINPEYRVTKTSGAERER